MAPTALLFVLISLPAFILCDEPAAPDAAATAAETLPPLAGAENNIVVDVNRVFRVSSLMDKANWFKAEQHCVANKMHLASIMHDEDNNKLANLMKRHSIDKLWIGANDMADNGRWYWAGNGLPLNYTSWDTAEGQPNGGEHCVLMTKGGFWHDYGCTAHEIHFVCE